MIHLKNWLAYKVCCDYWHETYMIIVMTYMVLVHVWFFSIVSRIFKSVLTHMIYCLFICCIFVLFWKQSVLAPWNKSITLLPPEPVLFVFWRFENCHCKLAKNGREIGWWYIPLLLFQRIWLPVSTCQFTRVWYSSPSGPNALFWSFWELNICVTQTHMQPKTPIHIKWLKVC